MRRVDSFGLSIGTRFPGGVPGSDKYHKRNAQIAVLLLTAVIALHRIADHMGLIQLVLPIAAGLLLAVVLQAVAAVSLPCHLPGTEYRRGR